LQSLNAAYSTMVKDGVSVLAINIGESEQTVKRFVEKNKYAFPVLLDKNSAVAGQYQVMGIPTYVLMNKNGEIVIQQNEFPMGYKGLVSK
jgi:peroxiredoxin